MPKTKVATLSITGKVTARSPYGIKMEQLGDEWINFSKEEYREEPWEWDDVQKGDWVTIKRSGKYFKSITLIEPPTGESMVSRPDGAPHLGEEDPFEGMETEPPGDRRNTLRNPIATAREDSIQKQVALKCAVELAIGMAGPPPAGGIAGPINADYVVSIFRKFRDALSEEAK